MIHKTKDTQAILSIARQNPHYFDQQGLSLMAKDVAIDDVYGYYLEKQILGFLALKTVSSQVAEISWMAVLPSHQNQGIGSALLEHALGEITATFAFCKVKTLAHTVADEGFERTRHFYQQHGFISIEVIDPYPTWSPGNPCEILIRKLN